MLLIGLTSIPPRYGQLPKVLTALLAQRPMASRVIVTRPKAYRRFAPAPLPDLPQGVTVIDTEDDLGPIGKLLGPARAHPHADVVICDDDWLYGEGWLAALMATARNHPGQAVAASTYPTERIGHQGGRVAQGFGGVFLPAALAQAIPEPSLAAWPVDDIWISGHIEASGAKVIPCEAARAVITPLSSQGALQDTGDRDAANRAAAAAIHTAHGIWPPL